MKTAISVETPADLPPSLADEKGISGIPLHILAQGKDYLDGKDIRAEDIYAQYSASGTLPKTAAVSVGEYEEFFDSLTADDAELVHISLGSGLSSTFRNAQEAAKGRRVFVVDSCSLSSGIALLALEGSRLINGGADAKKTAKELEKKRGRLNVSFVPETLEYIRRGGRCSAVAAFGANLLSLHPCLEMQDGKLVVGKKYRGRQEKIVESYVADRLSGSFEKNTAFVTHSGIDSDVLRKTVRQVRGYGFENVHVAQAGCTIAAHCGPATLGVLFFNAAP